MKKVILFVLALSFTSTAVLANEVVKVGDAAKGKALSAVCAACHGADGNSVNPDWPKIAGQGEAYLVKQIHDFRADKRTEAMMTPMAKGIASDDDVLHLAAYYASQKQSSGTASKEKVKAGEKIYRGGIMSSGVAACSSCHGPTGEGNSAAKFPKIAGQHSKYAITQLKAFRKGTRNNDMGKMMHNVVAKMSDTEIEAVVEYVAGLH